MHITIHNPLSYSISSKSCSPIKFTTLGRVRPLYACAEVRRTDHDCFLNVLVREISPRPSHFSSMACLANLKRDIKLLESTFTKDHDRFQICSASLDELTCRFVGRNGEQYDIQANITVHPFVLHSVKTVSPTLQHLGRCWQILTFCSVYF